MSNKDIIKYLMLIDLTQRSTPCLPHRGRWPSAARSEGVSLQTRGHSPGLLRSPAPSERGPRIRFSPLLSKTDKH